jgi:hypothetical protein
VDKKAVVLCASHNLARCSRHLNDMLLLLTNGKTNEASHANGGVFGRGRRHLGHERNASCRVESLKAPFDAGAWRFFSSPRCAHFSVGPCGMGRLWKTTAKAVSSNAASRLSPIIMIARVNTAPE